MINVTVLTPIDEKVYKFIVEDTITILELKQHMAGVVNVPVPEQQLIFLAQVLNDETKIAEIGINGNVIHLIRRALPLEPRTSPVTYTDSPGHQFGPPNMHSSDYIGSQGMGGVYNRIIYDNIRKCIIILNRLNPLISGTSNSVSQRAEDVSTPTTDILRFGEIIRQLSVLNIRLQPFYTQYIELVYVDPPFASIERSQSAQRIFDGLSEVSNLMTNTFRVLGNLRPCPHGYGHGPCPNCSGQPTTARPFAEGQSVPSLRTFRPDFMNQVRASNPNYNASTSATRADTANTNAEYRNASLEFSSETPNGVGHMHSYYSFDHAPGSPEIAFATPNAAGSSRPTAFPHWSGPMNGQASSGVLRHFISDQPITSTGIGSASTGFLVHRHGHTGIANNRTGSSTGTDPRSNPHFLSHLNLVQSERHIFPHHIARMYLSDNVNPGEQNINSFANSSPRKIGQRLSMPDWPLHRSPIPTTRIQSASTRNLVLVPRHTSQFMGQFLPPSSHHIQSNCIPRMPSIRSAHRFDMSTFSSSSTSPEFRPTAGDRNLMAEPYGFLPYVRPIQIPGSIHHNNIATTSLSNNAQAREQENEPEIEQTSNVANEEQTNNFLPTQPDVINGRMPYVSIGSQGSTIYHDIPSELGPEIVENSRCQKRQRSQSPNIDANFSDTSNKQKKMD